jgi:hypothetical protein
VELALGASVSTLASYFDTCRRKRNILDYDNAQVVTETEAKELVQEAEELRMLVEQWIAQHYPPFAASP